MDDIVFHFRIRLSLERTICRTNQLKYENNKLLRLITHRLVLQTDERSIKELLFHQTTGSAHTTRLEGMTDSLFAISVENRETFAKCLRADMCYRLQPLCVHSYSYMYMHIHISLCKYTALSQRPYLRVGIYSELGNAIYTAIKYNCFSMPRDSIKTSIHITQAHSADE